MRLSEAIRLGALLRAQGRGAYLDDHHHTCTLGAALEAIGRLERAEHVIVPWGELWPWLCLVPACRCPADCGTVIIGLIHLIAHVNDDHCWTRERIADWVTTIEAEYDREAAAVSASLAVSAS